MHGSLGRNSIFTQLHAGVNAVRNGVEISVGSIRRCMFDGCVGCVGDAGGFATCTCE